MQGRQGKVRMKVEVDEGHVSGKCSRKKVDGVPLLLEMKDVHIDDEFML